MSTRLKEKEFNIMWILLNTEEPLTASQIASKDESFTVNIVQAILRKLLKMGLVEVSDIVYSRNVLSRTFAATEKSTEIIRDMFIDEYRRFLKFVPGEILFSTMLQSDPDLIAHPEEVEKLEEILKHFKEHKEQHS